jgi:hypothetical protein
MHGRLSWGHTGIASPRLPAKKKNGVLPKQHARKSEA